MIISSSVEAGTLIGSLREMRGLSRRELSAASGVPLRTVYAAENGELRNMSIDRVISLLSALGANLNVEVEAADAGEVRDDETNVLGRRRTNQASGWFGSASHAHGAQGPGNARRRPAAPMCE